MQHAGAGVKRAGQKADRKQRSGSATDSTYFDGSFGFSEYVTG